MQHERYLALCCNGYCPVCGVGSAIVAPVRVLTRFTSRPIEPIKDRPWKNPALEATLEALPRMSTAAEAVDAALAYLRPLRARVEEHVQASQEVGDALVPGLTHLRERHHATGSQDAEQADLLALLGRALIARAWQVRGSDGSSTRPARSRP